MSDENPKGGGTATATPPPSSLAPPPQPSKSLDKAKDFASTHRVKKLLETYTMTAERSMMGPDASENAFNDQKYFGGYSTSAYKLPPDVELSKTSLISEATHGNNGGQSESAKVDVAASRRLQIQMTSGGLKGGGPMSPPPLTVNAKSSNGLVTLSRIDGNGFSEADYMRNRSRSGSHDPRHLSGEVIRQMSVLNKKGSANAAAAAASIAYQQQLQMQATYERVLKEKSYLRYNKPEPSKPSSTTTSNASATSAASLPPVFSARDRGQANLSETRLASRDIACFEVGGEKRCCLPQILNSVLDQISLGAIHAACDELQIYCSTCTHEQLDVLKLAKIIPNTASQCGLITKSDAERLCSRLLDCSPPLANMVGFQATTSPFSFRVQHECFGKCRGIVLPEAYTSGSARCIECLECEGLFCPAKFVCHSHRNRENRTCHWGFDSANWRAYLHLADDYTDQEQDKLSKMVAEFKSRFQSNHKRKLESYNGSRERSLESKSPRHQQNSLEVKKAKLEEPFSPQHVIGDPYGLILYQQWAAATAGKAGPMHPAAAAAISAFSNHYTQAIKDGKVAPPPGFPVPRPSSSSSNGNYHQRSYESKMSPHGQPSHPGLIKSSPLSDESPSERLSQSIESPGDHLRKKPSSSSLAEDILAIRAALDGASPSAREKTLKTLERLTARLALAESERDMALDQLKKLQRRYEMTEDELHKKRAELREALQNDASPQLRPDQRSSSNIRSTTSTLEVVSSVSQNEPPSGTLEVAANQHYKFKKYDRCHSIPKMDLKSPTARIIEQNQHNEKSCENSSRSSRSATPPISASGLLVTSTPVDDTSNNTNDSLPMKSLHLRRRSGTPASVRSRESEDLRERMMTMEAELRALRDELSNRSSLASNQSSQATTITTKDIKDGQDLLEDNDKKANNGNGNNGNGHDQILDQTLSIKKVEINKGTNSEEKSKESQDEPSNT